MKKETTHSKFTDGDNATDSPCRCPLINAYKKMPKSAQLIAMRITGQEFPIRNAEDVLIWVCKLLSHQIVVLIDIIKRQHPTWLRYDCIDMSRPKHIGNRFYVDLNDNDQSPLQRAAMIMEWMSWPRNDITLVYRMPERRISQRKLQQLLNSLPVLLECDEKKLVDDIRSNYPSGFDFKETSCALVGARVGVSMGKSVIEYLQKKMFERSDGLWLFPGMVVDDIVLKEMITCATEFLTHESVFALDSLYVMFEDRLHNVANGQDFKRFFNAFVADKVRGKVRGNEGWRVCFREDADEVEGWKSLALRVHGALVSAGDAVSVDDLILQLPHLNRDVILRACTKNLNDAVVFAVDGIEYVKLLEAYYLPDDFGTVLVDFIHATEDSQSVTSIVLLEGLLDERYGEGFRTNYGLDDEAVFKQVVAMSSGLGEYEWKRDMFVDKAKKASANVVDVFLTTHGGMFHEEEFFKFAQATRGMTNRGMLIATFLRVYCIRLSKEWWISEKAFDAMFRLSSDDYSRIGISLNDALAGKKMCPIACLSQSVYDVLPRLQIDEKTIEWNPYLLTSVAVKKVRNAVVVNDEPSPYTVTAFIIPPGTARPSDVIEYALASMPKGYFKGVDEAFDFLKTNNVRMAKTDKLVAKISEFLGQ